MTMRVVFLGRIGERAGGPRTLDTEGLATVADATARLSEAEPDLAALLSAPSTITVLDDAVARADTPLGDARELAYLPPVSGG